MNLPFAPILRPQRAVDIIISFDFTARQTDDGMDENFDPLKQVLSDFGGLETEFRFDLQKNGPGCTRLIFREYPRLISRRTESRKSMLFTTMKTIVLQARVPT